MSVAPNAGLVDLDTFLPPSGGNDGLQGQVPKPLAGQENYVLTASGFTPAGSVPGLGTLATQNANAVAITGGTIDNSVIGGTTPAAGTFTTLTAQTEVLKGTGQNLLLQSQALATSPWATVNVTSTNNASTAPDSTSTATSLVPAATTGSNHYISQVFTTVLGTNYTFSFYFKANGYTSISLGADNGGYANFDLSGVASTTFGAYWSNTSITSAGSGWYRCVATYSSASFVVGRIYVIVNATYPGAAAPASYTGNGTSGVYAWGAQVEFGSIANTYIPTTTTAVYGTPTLSFSGVAGIGLQSDGSLYVQPAGTGAVQAQATTSTATGGNARGANAVDWQTSRGSASNVASGAYTVIAGGGNNGVSQSYSAVLGGYNNIIQNGFSSIVGGYSNTIANNSAIQWCFIGGGYNNQANGFFNFIGGGNANSATSQTAVTTQSGTMNATTAVTLSGSNASIKVGQYITGTSIASNTYVAAVSGTSLTLSQAASGSSTSTLSFYTPHGVVVGGGNNQATGSYSFIGGGGDAGTAGNRNVASGDWSFVGGGIKNTASGNASVIAGGGFDGINGVGNTASGLISVVGGGVSNQATATGALISGGAYNTASGNYSTVVGGEVGTTRGIQGQFIFGLASGNYNRGNFQSGLLNLFTITTDATPTVLASTTSAAGTTNQIILPNNSAYYFKGTVVAGVTGGGNTKGWTVEGVIKRGANAASTAIVGTATVMSAYADVGAATWALTATADTTNGGLAITFTGQAATTIRVVAKIETTEMTY